MTVADLDDPVTQLAVAQRRLRRRALLIAGAGAVLVAAIIAAVWWSGRPAPYPPPIARPYLWRVDGAHPSYLLGTVHVEYGFDDLPASVRAAFAGATTVLVESDLLAPRRAAPAPAISRARRRRRRCATASWVTGSSRSATGTR